MNEADKRPEQPVGTRRAGRGNHARAEGAQRMGSGTTGRTGRKWIRWTVAMKETFLDYLAATCNVSEAARAIAADLPSVYYLRRADPAFATNWAEALRLGYEMLETRLVGHALAGGGDTVAGGGVLAGSDRPIADVNVTLALQLLRHHAAGRAPRKGRPPLIVTRDDTDEVILRRLQRIAARCAAPAPLLEHGS